MYGGEILFVEASTSKGKGQLSLTGNLGDVMKESATLAYEYIKSHSKLLQIEPELFENNNVHIHVPEGATPKDGPSAGITMFTSMVSVFTNKKVNPKIAMTGEITLRGKVKKYLQQNVPAFQKSYSVKKTGKMLLTLKKDILQD